MPVVFERKKNFKNIFYLFVEGNKLIKLKKPNDLNIEEEREFLDDGNTMNLHLRYSLIKMYLHLPHTVRNIKLFPLMMIYS